MSFWGELKRRNVYKVGVAYAIVAWLLIQAASIIFPHMRLPEWAVPLVIAFLIIGFPIALLLAWAYEVTPEGIKKTKEVPLAESITHLTGQKLNYIVTGLLVIAVGLLVVKDFFLDRRVAEPEAVSTETEQAPVVSEEVKAKKTIAVLPFVNLSSDPEQEYFVDGLSEELLNSLAKIPDLLVTARTSSFTFKGSDKKVQEIAHELGVENILEGSVRKAGNALRISAQLIRATDGFHLWSETYDRELKDIFVVQEDIAKTVANELKVTLGIDRSLRILGGTDNVEAYELYLVARGQCQGIERSWDLALKSIDAAITIDPEFALAWELKSELHNNLSFQVTADQVASMRDAGLRAALKAIELEPNLASGYVSLAYGKSISGDFIEAGLAYRKALEMTTYQPEGLDITHYIAVGYIDRVNEIIEEARNNDPLNPNLRAWYINSLAFLGKIQQAEKEYEHGRALYGDDWVSGNIFITTARLGSGDVVSRDKILWSSPINNAVKEYIDSPKEGLAELRQLYINNDNLSGADLIEISTYAAYFGDPEFALDATVEAVALDAESIGFLWLPICREVRQTPRFKKFVKEIGLVDYWNEFGWPDICHQLDNGDFECD